MNENIFDVDFTKTLPPTLKNDKNMLGLAKVVADELQKTARLSRLNLIYARIDELEENVLDILAYDLHVDWYAYDYPIAAKRAIIKDSVAVHKRLGTLYAVKKALGSVYPQSEVEEWFDYGGEPFSFRVVLDVTSARASAEYFAIKKAVESYKRLTAHMDDLIYQCRSVVEIRIGTDVFYLGTVMAGQHVCGTYPQRSTLAGIACGEIDVTLQGNAFAFDDTPTGTRPQRAELASMYDITVWPETDGAGYEHKTGQTGEYFVGIRPQVASGGVDKNVDLKTVIAGKGYNNINSLAGTSPQISKTAAITGLNIESNTNGKAFVMDNKRTGIMPQSSVLGNIEGAGFSPLVTAETFAFVAKVCGTGYCKND